MYFVFLETSGNQRYIFSSNRLAENVGASELTFRAGTVFLFKALSKALSQCREADKWRGPIDQISRRHLLTSRDIRNFLRDPKRNPPIDPSAPAGPPIEIIQATSGKALLLVREKALAEAIVRETTLMALREAPGIDLTGVISEEFDLRTADLDRIIHTMHQSFRQARSSKPGPELRFPGIPFVAQCRSSSLPASECDKDDGDLSEVALAKRRHYRAGWDRLNATAEGRLTRSIDQLEKCLQEGERWLAIIHADGNGIGQVFKNFGKNLSQRPINIDRRAFNREYLNALREFSCALEECTEDAFKSALETLQSKSETERQNTYAPRKNVKEELPLVPLVLGGDDLTVICWAGQALPFTMDFLHQFEKQTAEKSIFKRVTGNQRVTMAAGVAIVKSHFPFHLAYDLAEQLLQSAKKSLKRKAEEAGLPTIPSAFDFHVHRDTSGADLDDIRRRLEIVESDGSIVRLYGGPYLCDLDDSLAAAGANDSLRQWAQERLWQRLLQRVQALNDKDAGGRRLLPSSQMHFLREGLFAGRQAAERRLKMIRSRYANQGLEPLLAGSALFWQDADGPSGQAIFSTGFLDAMEAASIWRPPHEFREGCH